MSELGVGGAVGFVGTYPPTRCGIATFTESLRQEMRRARSFSQYAVISCVDEPCVLDHPPEVIGELMSGSRESMAAAAVALNGLDVVIVQHEFGIFGGENGDEILELAAMLNVPIIVVLHTVLRHPSSKQREIVEQLAEKATSVVVLSATARERLLTAYTVTPQRVHVIPHGAHLNLGPPVQERERLRRQVILTWGLIGRDKGIEFAIEALAHMRDLDPSPRYVVLGQTHPRVLSYEGEAYRAMLVARAREFEVDHLVEFENYYADTNSLLRRVRSADIVLLPYRSREQDVSGVLVEAITAGKPVVATRFPHAVELVGTGSGILVPHEDPLAIAAALRSLLTTPALAAHAAAQARRQAPAHDLANIGRCYRRLVAAAVGARAPD
jgi:glycosyltransferase involved in cell wall biosynthesis